MDEISKLRLHETAMPCRQTGRRREGITVEQSGVRAQSGCGVVGWMFVEKVGPCISEVSEVVRVLD